MGGYIDISLRKRFVEKDKLMVRPADAEEIVSQPAEAEDITA